MTDDHRAGATSASLASFTETTAAKDDQVQVVTSRDPSPPNFGRRSAVILDFQDASGGRCQLHQEDYDRLAQNRKINNEVIDMGIRYYITRFREDYPRRAARIHYINPFFYTNLVDGKSHSDLQKYTSYVNFFQSDFIVIPVHLLALDHWILVIVCYASLGLDNGSSDAQVKLCILCFDSCEGQNLEVLENIGGYVQAEARLQGLAMTEKLPSYPVPVPLQDNDVDCGLHVIKNVYAFLLLGLFDGVVRLATGLFPPKQHKAFEAAVRGWTLEGFRDILLAAIQQEIRLYNSVAAPK